MNSDKLYNNQWINIDGNNIHHTAIIHPNVKLGKGNTIGAYCVIGGNGEIRGVKQEDFKGHVEIGDNNIISEFVSIQRPYEKGKITKIGSDNIIMAHSHLGHDVRVYDQTEICTNCVIGGYAQIHFRAKIKLGVIIRNRIVIGSSAIVGMGSVVTKSVDQYAVVYGNPAKEKKRNE
jgi:UDP-N-acetylglucosamine acyltransferase